MLAEEIVFTIGVIVFGLVVGSFCNNWAYRMCRGESVAKGRSRCPHCEHILHTRDLVPVASYIHLKGECRYCKEKISYRYIAVEIVTAIAYLLLWREINPFIGEPIEFIRWGVLLFFLITLTLQDLETYELSDGINLAGAVWFLVLTPFAGDLRAGLIGGLSISLPLLLFSLVADKILKKDTMGGGDIKLIAMLGLHLGFPLTLLALIVSCFIGVALALCVRTRDDGAIPFGPAICLASFITALWGEQLLHVYLSLF